MVYKKILLIFLLSVLASKAFSTSSTQSLEMRAILAKDDEKPFVLNQLAEELMENDTQKALYFSQEALKWSQTQKNRKAEAISLKNIGMAYKYLLSDTDKALEYTYKALRLVEIHGFKEEEVEILSTIALIYTDLGNNIKALENYIKASILAREAHLDSLVPGIENQIGHIYSGIGSHEKAVQVHQDALQLAKSIKNITQEAELLNSLGQSYINMGNLTKGSEYINKSLIISREHKAKRVEAKNYLHLGIISQLQDDPEKALEFYKKALAIYNFTKDKKALSHLYNVIGSACIEIKDYKRAIDNINIGLKYGVEINSKKTIRDSYDYLYNCYAALKDYKKALQYKDFYIAISDLIYSEDSEQRIAEMRTKYEVEKREAEIENLKKDQAIQELQLTKERNLKNFLLIGILMVVTILGLIGYLYIQNKKNNKELSRKNIEIESKNQQLEELNSAKDKFFSIIAHDLKGPLHSLTSFAGLLINHTSSLSVDEIKMLATDLDKSLKSLFGLLENLLEWARSQTGRLEFKAEDLKLKVLIDDTLKVLQSSAQNKKITFSDGTPPEISAWADKHSVTTVIRNLVSNAVKFTQEGGTIEVKAANIGGVIKVIVKDSGVGMAPEILNNLFKLDKKVSTKGTANEKGTGLGLILCKDFIEKNGGEIFVESTEGSGTTFSFTLPERQRENI